MSKGTKNIAASVRQKLKNRAVSDRRPFSELLQYYAMERFLYRLTVSEYVDRYILKGALMLSVWQSPEIRPTMDIDLLGKTSNEVDNVSKQISDIISIDLDDGLTFDPLSIKGETIKEDADYEGVRVRFIGSLDNARVDMQVDVGFGDIVHPDPVETKLPSILDSPTPKLLCYSRETAIAEKLEAMIKLGEVNSRMKDFYDIWLLSRQFEFSGADLAEAVKLTLDNRGTDVPEYVSAFTQNFIDKKQIQWKAFKKRLKQEHVSSDFRVIVEGIQTFLDPIILALKKEKEFSLTWSIEDHWK